MFGYELTLNRVYDTVRIKEGGQTLTLHVNADPSRVVVGLSQAQKRLVTITEETTDAEREEIALFFASVLFGEEQARKLLEFYYGESSCVVSVCAQYFAKRLKNLITKAQKKSKK